MKPRTFYNIPENQANTITGHLSKKSHLSFTLSKLLHHLSSKCRHYIVMAVEGFLPLDMIIKNIAENIVAYAPF